MGARAPLIGVYGLWHLGSVTAAGLASLGHRVLGIDEDAGVVERLAVGVPPVSEPGLAELVREGTAAGRLRFAAEAAAPVEDLDVLWITIDTPVNDEDEADVGFVVERVARLTPRLKSGAIVLISSQVPVGTTARLGAHAYSPENLRLGKAIDAFLKPERIVVGVRDPRSREAIGAVFAPIGAPVEWMSAESAEMTKHAINAFLATSAVFMNELATLCESVGADAKEVERGLRTEGRIGKRAYLAPGPAIAGGTLLRDVGFLAGLAPARRGSDLFDVVRACNRAHQGWPRRKIEEHLRGEVSGRTVAVLGLAYKPGTDTLRRSSSIELCAALVEKGARVRAHDPAVKAIPGALGERVELAPTVAVACAGADAIVVSTPWPEYQALTADALAPDPSRRPVVIDAFRVLPAATAADARLLYVTVGAPAR